MYSIIFFLNLYLQQKIITNKWNMLYEYIYDLLHFLFLDFVERLTASSVLILKF